MAVTDRFKAIIAAIDAANDADPVRVLVGSAERSAATVYGERMSACLDRLSPMAGELLRIAVRAQHLERFKLPRPDYPAGKQGYYRWRNEQKRRHAERLAGLMRVAGYDEAEAARAAAIVRKDNLRADAEAQLLEDCACLVFLEHEFAAFATQHPPEKLVDIVAKTWGKMSPLARGQALMLPLPAELAPLVHEAVARHDAECR